jgi:hypothetical protein
MADERRIRELAHQLWEEEGRPGGRERAHWAEAERRLRAEAEGLAPTAPDQGPVDPLRNPVPIPPAEDPEYPAITGPEELPPGVSHAGLNPSEVIEEGTGPGSTGRRWTGKARLRRRPGKSTLEP